MQDKIQGAVTGVLGQNAFMLFLTSVHRGNKDDYSLHEYVICEANDKDDSCIHSSLKDNEHNLLGLEVTCTVLKRFKDGKLHCIVKKNEPRTADKIVN